MKQAADVMGRDRSVTFCILYHFWMFSKKIGVISPKIKIGFGSPPPLFPLLLFLIVGTIFCTLKRAEVMGQEEEEGPRNVTLLLSGHLQNLASQILQTIGPITGTFLRSGHL